MDPRITEAYARGLAILKPSARDLEVGLRLHREALVFDAYGFAPLAPMDGDALRQAAGEGASQEELKDLREHQIMSGQVRDLQARSEAAEAWEAAGVTCVFQNAGEECQAPLQHLKRFARHTQNGDLLRGHLVRATLPEDVEAAKRAGKHCLYLTTNGVPLAQQWRSAEEELAYLPLFFQMGCRMMHLTYNRRNLLGDGCMEAANGGLSDFGRLAIAELNRCGLVCDVAHSGWQTSLEAAQLSRRPMVASHTTCAALHAHPRAKPDGVIKAIADTGGYVGVCCVSGFLGGAGDLSRFLDHLDYLMRRFGAEHVAIGTDKAHSAARDEQEWAKLQGAWPKARAIFESYWPEGTLPGADDPSLAWTNWPLFTVGLVQRGHSEAAIRQVLGGNVLRVARAALEGIVAPAPAAP